MDSDSSSPSTSTGEISSRQTAAPIPKLIARDLDYTRCKPPTRDDAARNNDCSNDYPGISMGFSAANSPASCTSDITFDSSDIEESEPGLDTPQEHARYRGLCEDYGNDDPLFSDLIPSLPEDAFEDLDELAPGLDADFIKRQVKESLNERLDVDKGTATFLLSVLATGKGDLDSSLEELIDSRLKPLKLELPVLARDHEVEMIALRRRNEVKLTAQGIEPFVLDFEKDEGLVFPTSASEEKCTLDRELENEKLDVGREMVGFLRDVKGLAISREADYAAEAHEAYTNGRTIRLSPPLMPTTPPYSPGEPDMEAVQIEMTSTPENLLAKDAALFEKQVLENSDNTQVPANDGSALSGEATAAVVEEYIAVPASSSPRLPKRLRDLQVEPPLTPQNHDETASVDESGPKESKKMRFDSDLATLFPELQQDAADASFGFDDQEGAAALQDAFQARALSVEKEIREEQLVEVDTTMRVKVPHVEEISPRPAWEIDLVKSTGAAKKRLQQDVMVNIQRDLLIDQKKWAGVSSVERSLSWAPFSSLLAKVDLHGEFDDGSLARYLGEIKLDNDMGDIDVESLTGMDDRMRSLRRIEDEEDIGAVQVDDDGSFEQQYECDRAKQRLDVPDIVGSRPDTLGCAPTRQQSETAQADAKGLKPESERPIKPPLASASATIFQTDGIEKFMNLHGKSSSAHHDLIPQGQTSPKSLKTVAVPSAAPPAVMVPRAESLAEPPNSPFSIPVPPSRTDITRPVPIVASLEFLSKRQLMRYLETSLPRIELIERDALAFSGPGRSQNTPNEADLTISPSTGVIITTLQKIKQKPLPGQKQFCGVKNRIISVATRYERLIVLVSEGNLTSTQDDAGVRPLDQLDCEALADLTAWALSLDSGVEITYIPGSERSLASWLAALISHRGITDGSLPLLQDETMWERWLRKAGVNPFAAQAVLYQLKPHESVSEESSSLVETGTQHPFGLTAFLMMDFKERLRRFAPILGGERVLRQVSDLIDRPWSVKVGGDKRYDH